MPGNGRFGVEVDSFSGRVAERGDFHDIMLAQRAKVNTTFGRDPSPHLGMLMRSDDADTAREAGCLFRANVRSKRGSR